MAIKLKYKLDTVRYFRMCLSNNVAQLDCLMHL